MKLQIAGFNIKKKMDKFNNAHEKNFPLEINPIIS